MNEFNVKAEIMWTRVESTDWWVWYPQLNIQELNQRQKRQLRANGWKPIPAPRPKYLFCIMGQLLPLYRVQNKTGGVDFWARELDILHVNAFPVALASPPPSTQLDPATTSSFVEPSSPVPNFAKIGLILTGSSVTSFPLDLLGEGGITCWKHVVEMMNQLASTHNSYEQWIHFTEEVRTVIQQLVVLYWQAHQRRKPALRSLPEIPNIFHMRAYAPVPIVLPVQAVFAAFSNAASAAPKWEPSDINGYPRYQYNHPETIIDVEMRPSTPGELDETMMRSLWHQVLRLGDLDSDVYLAALAQITSAPKDAEGYVWLTASQILDHRAIKPMIRRESGNSVKRHAGHRQEDYDAIAACFSRLTDIWVAVRQSNDHLAERRKKKKGYSFESRLLEVDEVIQQHELRARNSAVSSSTSRIIAWHYRLGPWFRDVTAGAEKQIAWLSQQVLHYNLQHYLWEKRLARYILCHLRVAPEGCTIVRSIEMLINELSLPIDLRNPERTRERFVQAMQTLEVDYQIDSWGPELDNELLPKRHWLKTWLSWKIHITVAPFNVLRAT